MIVGMRRGKKPTRTGIIAAECYGNADYSGDYYDYFA